MAELLWAPLDFISDLQNELQRRKVKVLLQKNGVFVIEDSAYEFAWAEARARHAELIQFSSISEAQSLLRDRGRLWSASPLSHFRRSELILEGLTHPRPRPKKAFEKRPQGSLGVFSLVSESEAWVSAHLEPAVPPRSWEFEESSLAPSRAYLKLWELFTREGFAPEAGARCLELGSAPGGWTWVLESLGCHVIAVDKGEMSPEVLKSTRVEWLRKDAFAQDLAARVGPVDWFFSDLICYPHDLLALVRTWKDQGLAKNFVCTIKFQGTTDFDALEKFLEFPGSHARHLQHNKHELTWFLLAK